jgi:hypothetical protein
LYQNAEAALAYQQRILRRFTLRDVAGDLREANVPPRLVLDRVKENDCLSGVLSAGSTANDKPDQKISAVTDR